MEARAPRSTRARRRETDDSRAERKRVQDRLAQRATRERTKNRIAFLEERLSSLEAGDKQGEIASLTRTIDSLRNDNHRLRNALVKMRTAIDQAVLTTEDQSDIQTCLKPCGCRFQTACTCSQTPFDQTTPSACDQKQSAFQCDDDGRHKSSSTDASEGIEAVKGHGVGMGIGVEMDINAPQSDTIAGLTGLEDFFDLNPSSLLDLFEMGPTGYNAWSASTPSPLDYRFPSRETVKVASDMDKWHVSNGAFVSALDSVTHRKTSHIDLDPHVPFKAVIWGWDNVGPEAQHPIWKALRQVDQRVFGTWTSKAQRIALMYVCQTLIQYRENPTKENLVRVPVFLRPRYVYSHCVCSAPRRMLDLPQILAGLRRRKSNTQQSLTFSYGTCCHCLIAVFPSDHASRPGLRDRLVFEHKKYTSTGAFSAAFVDSFNFYWPYSDRDIFAYDPVHNRYEVSKIFLDYAYNFKNWTMKPDFFKKFPEMQHDIAAFEETVNFPRASWTV